MESQNAKQHGPVPGYSLPPPTKLDPAPSINLSDAKSGAPNFPWCANTTFALKASIGKSAALEYTHRAPETPAPSTVERQVPEHQHGHRSDLPDDSLFSTKSRIASTTKLFTVLAILRSKEKIRWDDPITKFVPELDEKLYGEVTIGSLADHTSGLGRFGYVGDLAFVPGFNTSMLAINPAENTLPGVDIFPGGRVATHQQVIDMFNHPFYAASSPNSAPLYSNITYNLLGMALCAVHNMPYEVVINDLILTPLNMTNSTFDTPSNDGTAILPKQGQQWFAAPFGNFNASGGLWSTPNDLQRFLEAILTHKLLSPAQTRKWLSPTTFLPSLHQALGAGWEIIRPTDCDIAFPRPIDIYTKPGGVAGYAANAILIPEYGIAATMMAAGDAAGDAIKDLLPLVVKPLVAYADQQARSQALAKYGGTYRAADDSNSILTLALDHGPGLNVTTFIMNGIPVLPTLAALQNVRIPDGGPSARIYPSDVNSLRTGKEKWRLQLDRAKEENERGWADLDHASWNWGDALRYVGAPLDGLAFHMDEGGEKAIAVELVGWRTTLVRIDA